jgi:rhamnosyl/mannosyltransferase
MKVYKPFLYHFLEQADRILPTSPQLIEVSPFLKPFKDKCIVVPLWVDFKKLQSSPQKALDLPVEKGEKIVLFVGRLVYYKGLEYLIEAMKDVEAKLLIAGSGPLEKRLRQKSKIIGVGQKVIFLGKVSDAEIKYLYQICDVFVLPSVEPSEAFGLVQLEAMAYGKPVVNTNLPTGVPFVSRHGETGLTVPPRDPKALAEAINKILSDKELAQEFSRNAKRRAQEFSKEKALKQIYDIYCELITKP